MEIKWITEYFSAVETEEEYDGYFYSAAEAITIVMLGSICGLKNVRQIQQWAASEKVSEFLREKFAIKRVPCYYWLLCLLKMIKPDSLSQCFTSWVQSYIPREKKDITVAIDGKTICSTVKMKRHERPIHIISAQLSELGLTFAQQTVDGKSNEIPAVQALLKELDLSGCMITADALHCQKETAKTIVEQKADYLLNVKDNQPTLKADITDFIQDKALQSTMECKSVSEINRDRVEKRTAYVTSDVSWLENRSDWAGLRSIGAIHTQVETTADKTDTWHYYICSRSLAPAGLLHHARMEWTVETMHWLLDVHFQEDFFRALDKNVQQNMNILRKLSLNLIKLYKQSCAPKRALSHIMFDALLDPNFISKILDASGN